MFSKEMEALIEATLQDGVLTDQEKAVLVKRAQKEGIDVDELDVYIQSLLQKRQQEQIEKRNQQEEELEKEKAKAIGPVCPKCGKQVAPLTLKCECGYEFTKKKEVSSVQRLMEKIEKTKSSKKNLDTITMFPVPNTKEDIIEFLALSLPNTQKKGGILGTKKGRLLVVAVVYIVLLLIITHLLPLNIGDKMRLIAFLSMFYLPVGGVFISEFDTKTLHQNEVAEVWKAKFKQVMLKGRSLQGDPDFQKQLDYYENMFKKI